MNNIIPIDFVAGAHGHFLEFTLNTFFGFTDKFNCFTDIGTSHVVNKTYLDNRVFCAKHWFETDSDQIKNFPKIISIQFTQDDLLLLSSVSLLRAGDINLDNNTLEEDTYNKLNTKYYRPTLDFILKSYPFLKVDEINSSIPRNVLREFYKFGFANPTCNGYWIKQQEMQYPVSAQVFYFPFDSFYNVDKFVNTIKNLEIFLEKTFTFSDEFFVIHSEFLKKIPYKDHKTQCDQIIKAVTDNLDISIPDLSLFQESYINGQLENIYRKEMPFHNLKYFTSTKDVLQYINCNAPNL